jgi:hypothetical protein
MSCTARPARSAWPVAATPTAGGVGGAALAGGGRPPAQLRPEQPPLERQPVVERERRDAGWLLQLIAWPTWPSEPTAASKACPVWPLPAPVSRPPSTATTQHPPLQDVTRCATPSSLPFYCGKHRRRFRAVSRRSATRRRLESTREESRLQAAGIRAEATPGPRGHHVETHPRTRAARHAGAEQAWIGKPIRRCPSRAPVGNDNPVAAGS